RRGGGVERTDALARLGQDEVDRLHRALRLLGQHGGDVAGVVGGVGERVIAQRPDGRADRRHRQPDEADGDEDQAADGDAMNLIGHEAVPHPWEPSGKSYRLPLAQPLTADGARRPQVTFGQPARDGGDPPPPRPQKSGPAPFWAPALDVHQTALRYELALSTVTARRFCDQHEISLHTATGRSLP